VRRTLRRIPAIIGVLLVPAVLAQEEGARPATDLSRIDRTVAREPAYQSDGARYALLVFGPKANTRVWLVMDGDTLYVDRNGNGDLTEPGEALSVSAGAFDIGAITEADGTRHSSVRVLRGRGHVRLRARIHGLGTHYVGEDPGEPLQFGYRAEEAPIVHFGGSLTMRFYHAPPDLVAGKRTAVNVMIGTEGLGKGTFASLDCGVVLDGDAAPVADIAFPHKDPRRGPILVRIRVEDD